MPFWANAPKEASETITSEKNLQKLGSKSLTEVNARIDFDCAKYFMGDNQDSFVFNPQTWTEVKGAQGYVPTHTPSLIHFVRKEFKGFSGVKEVTPKDAFFTAHLSRLMESGKSYQGFIDTSIPQAMIDMINNPVNAAIVDQLLSPYINVVEVESTLFSSLSITESRGNSGSSWGGGSKSESEADKIKARQEAIKAVLTEVSGSADAKTVEYLDNPKFIALASLTLGLPVPSNLTYTF